MDEENNIMNIGDNQKEKKSPQEIERINERIIDDTISEILRHTDSMKDSLAILERIREYRREIYQLKVDLKDDLSKAYEKNEIDELVELKERVDADKRVLFAGTVFDIYAENRGNQMLQKAINTNKYPLTMVIEDLRNKIGKKYVVFRNDEKVTRLRKIEDGINIEQEETQNSYGKVIGRITHEIIPAFSINTNLLNKLFAIDKDEIYKIDPSRIDLLEKGEICSETQNDMQRLEKQVTEKINIMRLGIISKYYENEIKKYRDLILKRNIEETDREQVFE